MLEIGCAQPNGFNKTKSISVCCSNVWSSVHGEKYMKANTFIGLSSSALKQDKDTKKYWDLLLLTDRTEHLHFIHNVVQLNCQRHKRLQQKAADESIFSYLLDIVGGISATCHFGVEGRGGGRAVVLQSLRDKLVHWYELRHFGGKLRKCKLYKKCFTASPLKIIKLSVRKLVSSCLKSHHSSKVKCSSVMFGYRVAKARKEETGRF